MGIVKIKKKTSFAEYYKAGAFLGLTALLLLSTFHPKAKAYKDQLVWDTWKKVQPTQYVPVSESLGIKSAVKKGADNLVRITVVNKQNPLESSVGSGVLLDPWTIATAYHVVDAAHKGCYDVYIENTAFLGKDKYRQIKLAGLKSVASGCYEVLPNLRYSEKSDLAKITLETPVYGAHTLKVHKDEYREGHPDKNLKVVAYRSNELQSMLGHVALNHLLSDKVAAPTFYLSDINVGPGNSGSPVFNVKGELVGIVSAADAAELGEGKDFDTGDLLFTDINNALQ